MIKIVTKSEASPFEFAQTLCNQALRNSHKYDAEQSQESLLSDGSTISGNLFMIDQQESEFITF